MSTQGKRCGSCGQELPAIARFCLTCGEPQLPGVSRDSTVLATEDEPRDAFELTASQVLSNHGRPLPAGTVLNRVYTVQGVIGEGGMGIVYRGWDSIRKRKVAIKTLHPNMMNQSRVRRRFLREVELSSRWSHDHVVRIFDFFEQDGLLAFVMEYVPGPTLEVYLQRWRGQLPLDDIRMIFTGVLAAMGAAHARGVVHRDIKPQNILLQLDGATITPKLVDFGLAKVLDGTNYTRSGALLGTYRYMSPEQAQNDGVVDPRSDIYSLGVTLYRALTGRCPFDGNNAFAVLQAHIDQPPVRPSRFRPKLPAALEKLVLDALAKAPEARPQSCDDFSERLQAALADVVQDPEADSEPLPSVIHESDGHDLVLVGQGVFQHGPNRRQVFIDDFYLARYPVTNRQFSTFLEVTGYEPDDAQRERFLAHWRGRRCPPELEEHPVVFVSWHDAQAYCAWAGRRLPTEAEWEKGARGADGRKYPWGREEPTPEHANFGRRLRGTVAVGPNDLGASPYGLHAMAGNVWEWCEDVDDPAFYLHGPERNPRCTVSGGEEACVVRGGSWMFDARSLRSYARASHPRDFRIDGVGFRCAM
ncbi:MAG: SUMF1/EgtB/PvdO family nonheme iron enzyme [Myxococcales bacterium]|nr:SUMF1/EgtB/PvdO family nonheme iron enzyme [Myxococcales bacterium]